jgi:23S rRNA-/tRNA-specific pseudouridylate synthase
MDIKVIYGDADILVVDKPARLKIASWLKI